MKKKKFSFLIMFAALMLTVMTFEPTTVKAAELEDLHSEAAVSPASELAVGDEFTVSNITYCVTSVSPTLEVEAYYAPMRLTTITIPGTVTYNNVTYAVTSIPDGAFFDNYRTTKIVISEGVKTVGESAFQGCDAVTRIELPSTLESFTTMGFKSLQTITLASGNEHFRLVDGVLYTYDGAKLWLYPSGKAGTSYTVPEGTTVIGDSAFYENKYLQTITLADSVTTIEAYAFDTLNALTSITFEDSITSIGDHNLRSCPELVSVTFKNSGSLGNYCVYDCESLETIVIDGQLNGYGYFSLYDLPSLQQYQVTNSNYYTSRDGVLYRGTQLLRYPSAKTNTDYVVPDDTTVIAGLAFNYMQNTTTVVLNPGVTLNVMAFYYPNDTSPMTIYFRDETSVSLSASTSGVFVGMVTGSHIYLPTEAALESFNSYGSAVNPTNSATVGIGTYAF